VPIYEYKAYGSGGGVKVGVVDADTPREARSRLRRENLLVSELAELKGGSRQRVAGPNGAKAKPKVAWLAQLKKLRATPQGPSGKDADIVTAVTRQLGTLLGAGIPLAEALRAVIEQAESRRYETLFREIRERITQGASLGDALAEHPAYFSELYVNMVRAGEATGKVDQVLRRLAEFMQAQRHLQRKVISALTYPAMMIGLGVIVVSILMTAVVPKITAMLEDLRQTIPLPTRILIEVSNGFKNYWWVGCLAIAALSFLVERIYRTPRGRLSIDRFKLRVPLVGELIRKASVARFTRTLSTLLGSGVAAVQSLEVTRNVVGNAEIAEATDHIRTRILEGTDIATPLKATGVFPPVVGYMVAVGEKSGELEQMLDRIADAYDEEIEVVTQRLTTILEPIMIVCLATLVGFIVYSIILPILQVSNIT
jgi:general secretion pathway protein F